MLPNFKIGVGTISWGNQLIWDYGETFDEQSLAEVLQRSLQDGVRFFCTSEAFSDGESERILGRLASVYPGQVYIATQYAPRPWRIRRSDFARALNASLARLQVPSIDLYIILPPAGLMSIPMLVECAAEAVDSGKVRNIGVANFHPEQILEFHDLLNRFGVPLACVEAEYSLIHRTVENNGVLDVCRKLAVPFLADRPLAMGLLTGLPPDGQAENGLRRKLQEKYPREELPGLIRILNFIGSENDGRNCSQVALNWLIRKNVLPIPGVKTVDQVLMNNDSVTWNLSADQVARLDDLTAHLGGETAEESI